MTQEDVLVPAKFELYKDMAGKFRYRLKASNGNVLASSDGYDTKRSAMNGIKSLQKNATDAEIDDRTP